MVSAGTAGKSTRSKSASEVNPQKFTERRNARAARVSADGRHARLIRAYAAYRVTENITWEKLAELCGVSRFVLLAGIRRGTLGDRSAGTIVKCARKSIGVDWSGFFDEVRIGRGGNAA